MRKENKGITLLALVITVIILLILAAITLYLTIGENGIFRKAQYAKEQYENAQEKEQKELNNLYSEMLIATNDSSQITVNIEDLRDIIKQEVKEETKNIYPVGSIYISTEATNPSELFGGTWESYAEGKTLIGVGTGTDSNSISKSFVANTTGGEYFHTLTVDEMPSHNHQYQTMPMGHSDIDRANGSGCFSAGKNNPSNAYAYAKTLYYSSLTTGGSKRHNIVQPYIVTYVWKRVE